MIINSWSFKNYMSHGGTETIIELNKGGELILINGKNGSGKSALLNSLDIANYGYTLNKKGTKLAKLNYPNRVNGNMKVSSNITLNNGKTLEIIREMKNPVSTIKTTVKLDKTEHTPAKVNDFIEKELGMDFTTFKSFCSINVAYFKNFISLTPSDKRMILDKLFNMQEINELNKILKQLKIENNNENISIKSKLNTYKENIEELQESIDKFLKENKIDNTKEIEQINNEIKSFKDKYKELSNEIPEIEETIDLYETKIKELNITIQNKKRDIIDIDKKIKLYSLGKCPTCSHDLTEELNLLPTLNEEKEKINKVISKVQNKIDIGNSELIEYKQNLRKINSDMNKINTYISALESKLLVLSDKEDIDVSVFENNIESNNQKIKENKEKYLETEKIKYVHEVLAPIWTNDGIKKRIIQSIIDPINQFIKEDLEKIGFQYTLHLDDTFDAHVFDLMQEIDVDAMSSGETRIVNLVIMLAYIKMMRLNNDLNLLILDEVFTTIDLDGVDQILYILKEFAHNSKLSIFVVHHSQLKEYFFDKIYEITKPYFSVIEQK